MRAAAAPSKALVSLAAKLRGLWAAVARGASSVFGRALRRMTHRKKALKAMFSKILFYFCIAYLMARNAFKEIPAPALEVPSFLSQPPCKNLLSTVAVQELVIYRRNITLPITRSKRDVLVLGFEMMIREGRGEGKLKMFPGDLVWHRYSPPPDREYMEQARRLLFDESDSHESAKRA